MQSIKSAANYSKPFQKYKHFNKSILVSHIDCLFMAHVSGHPETHTHDEKGSLFIVKQNDYDVG